MTKTCAHCGATWESDPRLPPSERSWCSEACWDAWFAADPSHREDWIAVGELTPERLGQLLADVGLGIDADPVLLS